MDIEPKSSNKNSKVDNDSIITQTLKSFYEFEKFDTNYVVNMKRFFTAKG